MSSPRRVTIKGNNGRYLKATTNAKLQFQGTDRSEMAAAFEIFTISGDYVYIRSVFTGQFWNSATHGWITADTDKSLGNKDALFLQIPLDGIAIALRSMSNNQICQRSTSAGIVDGLSPTASGPLAETRLEVEDL